MKVNILQGELAKALGLSTHFVSTRAQLPILANVILEAKKTRLHLQSTNLEMSLSTSIGAQVEVEGQIAVPARTMAEIIQNLQVETITLEAEQENLSIKGEGFSGKLSGMNTNDFPAIPQSLPEKTLSLPSQEFTKALAQVLFSVSRDDARPILTGVLFIFHENTLLLVSSDGFRLSQKKLTLKEKGEDTRVVIPRTIMGELMRLPLQPTTPIAFHIDKEENQVLFGIEKSIFGSRVIDGEFPNFERIIPKSSRVTVSISRDELSRAIKIASVFAREAANTITLTAKEGVLIIAAESAKSGTQETQVPAKVTGGEVTIAYNFRFIEEFLSIVSGETIEILLNDTSSAGVFKDPADSHFLHLIMPVKV